MTIPVSSRLLLAVYLNNFLKMKFRRYFLELIKIVENGEINNIRHRLFTGLRSQCCTSVYSRHYTHFSLVYLKNCLAPSKQFSKLAIKSDSIPRFDLSLTCIFFRTYTVAYPVRNYAIFCSYTGYLVVDASHTRILTKIAE